jgi:SAM-dependent methyltransferase
MSPAGPAEGPAFDRIGAWLSGRRLRRHLPGLAGRRLGVFGCGYQATWARSLLDQVERAVLVDVALADDLRRHPRVQAIEARLPDGLAALLAGSLDLAVIASGLEDVADPVRLLSETRRLLAPGGLALVSAASWRAKRALELTALRLRLTSEARVTAHRRYYDVKDLRPLLEEAGFLPSQVRCFSQALGFITFAVCRVE